MPASTEGAKAARNVVMTDAMWEAIRVAAFEKRVSMSELIRDAVTAYRPLKPYLTQAD